MRCSRRWSEAVRYLRHGDESILRSEEHTSELQSRLHLVCRLLLEKKKTRIDVNAATPTTTRDRVVSSSPSVSLFPVIGSIKAHSGEGCSLVNAPTLMTSHCAWLS